MILKYLDRPATRQGRSRRTFEASKQTAKYLGARIKLLTSALRKNGEIFDKKAIENFNGLVEQLLGLLRSNPKLRKKYFALVRIEQEADGEIFLSAPAKILRDLGLGDGY